MISVHSIAFGAVANSHGEELVSESLDLKWVGLVSLVAVSGGIGELELYVQEESVPHV